MTRGRKLVFAAVVTAMLVLLALRIMDAVQDLAAPVAVDLAFTQLPEHSWNGHPDLVADPRTGHRPRRNHAEQLTVAPLASPTETTTITRRTSAQGLVRDSDLGESIPGPRILILGDDQTMGSVTAARNWTTLLEADLRATGSPLETATVLNAACDHDGLVQYVLRAPPLIERYRPEVVVVAIATGDDVTALDDGRMPHVDDAAFPTGPIHPFAADPLALGPRERQLCPDHLELARRGLAHAAYRQSHPEREPFLEKKTRQALRWLLETAPRGRLLAVLIPPADLARPAETAALCSEAGRELIAAGVQARAHAELLRLCDEVGLPNIDALDALATATGADLYQTDGRLGPAGHRALAAAVLARVRRLATLR